MVDRNKKAREMKQYEVLDIKQRIAHNEDLKKKNEEELSSIDEGFIKFVKDSKEGIKFQKDDLETTKKIISLEVSNMRVLNPTFEYETMTEYQELIKNKGKNTIISIDKKLEGLESQLKQLDNELKNNVEAKKKDLVEQNKRIELELKELKTKIGEKPSYTG